MAEDEPQEHEEDRRARLARALQDILKTGDAFQVIAGEDGVEVTDAPFIQFRDKHPRLYGRLLSLNQQMESGCAVHIIGFLLAGALCFGLNVGWWDEVLGPVAAEKLNSWWFFAVVLIVAFALGSWVYEWQERGAYRRGRDELLALVDEEGLERDTLLVHIKDDPELENVVKQLKLDPGPFRTAT